MSDQAERKVVDDVEERGEVEDMLGDAVGGARRPGAVAVAAQIERVDVVAFAEFLSDPIPIASVVERAVDQNEGRLAVLTVIPELQFEAVRVEEVGDGFHFSRRALGSQMLRRGKKIHGFLGNRQAEGREGLSTESAEDAEKSPLQKAGATNRRRRRRREQMSGRVRNSVSIHTARRWGGTSCEIFGKTSALVCACCRRVRALQPSRF